jgi:chemotaxis protein methyltransferase WspC
MTGSDQTDFEPNLLRAAQTAADHGRLAEALEIAGQVLDRNPVSAQAHYLRGAIHQALGSIAEAQRCFEKAIYLDPAHYQALVHLMLLAQQRGDGATAASYRRRAARCAPKEDGACT